MHIDRETTVVFIVRLNICKRDNILCIEAMFVYKFFIITTRSISPYCSVCVFVICVHVYSLHLCAYSQFQMFNDWRWWCWIKCVNTRTYLQTLTSLEFHFFFVTFLMHTIKYIYTFQYRVESKSSCVINLLMDLVDLTFHSCLFEIERLYWKKDQFSK